MKFFHTADWHLGKLVQGIYMTEDQEHILEQFIEAVKTEKPDAVVIAGDLYDRAVPPTDAVQLLNRVLETIAIDLNIPLLAISGNHDSPSRLHFGREMMRQSGFHITGELKLPLDPVSLNDESGEVHFHLVPYTDPSQVRLALEDEAIKTHDDALRAIAAKIEETKDPEARHVFVGHAFLTSHGEEKENTSTSERPLSIGGADQASAAYLDGFNYVALGHLHQAHQVGTPKVQYAGSPLKYSLSEQNHKKGYFVVKIDEHGAVEVEKRFLQPRRDMYSVEGYMADLLQHDICEDYVFVKLLDETVVLSAMEKIRSVYPNAMHVEREFPALALNDAAAPKDRTKMDDFTLFQSFYEEVRGSEAQEATEQLFKEALQELSAKEGERK
ncbi:exonuclease SbcCD subunit D [Alkalicoccus halolimnae]|uniref:Nuclease SbcCD subunit D n=1 Tax=Alkalicoccus halolimnae TaxID=1667239 RepID=A0A5C7FIR6_9BACI|nr:exonuclease SbcCD subunit D [Alkalicoccus halolimnae]TXF86194.1 exonuclease SbcCD subunit D [Alkalicoccus halolimnae]